MSVCKEIIEKISAWIDDELDQEESAKLSQHVANCPSCTEMVGFEKYSKSLLSEKIKPVSTPTHLQSKIVQALNTESVSKPFWRKLFDLNLFRPVPVTAVIVIVICMLSLYTYQSLQSIPAYVSTWWVCNGAAGCHEENIKGNVNLDFIETDPRVLIQKVNSLKKRDFALNLPNYNDDQFKLEGCRFCTCNKTPSIYVRFENQGHMVSLEMIKANGIEFPKAKKYSSKGGSYYLGKYEEFNVLIWEKNNLIYTLTSDLSPDTLTQMITTDMLARWRKI